METLSFAFGMLAMVAVVLTAVVVVGMVKVIKMQSTINSLHRTIDSIDSHVHQRISNEYSDLTRIIVDEKRELDQRISNDYQNLDRTISDDRKEMLLLHKESIDETIRVFEQVDKRLDELNRYVDSRFDKMENKFNGNNAKKQILND